MSIVDKTKQNQQTMVYVAADLHLKKHRDEFPPRYNRRKIRCTPDSFVGQFWHLLCHGFHQSNLKLCRISSKRIPFFLWKSDNGRRKGRILSFGCDLDTDMKKNEVIFPKYSHEVVMQRTIKAFLCTRIGTMSVKLGFALLIESIRLEDPHSCDWTCNLEIRDFLLSM